MAQAIECPEFKPQNCQKKEEKKKVINYVAFTLTH
jgi:hypothetical protein